VTEPAPPGQRPPDAAGPEPLRTDSPGRRPADRTDGHRRRGLFVVFEGGDGAGKSTQAQLLADWLSRRGHAVLLTFEPGDTWLGRQIRQIVLDPACPDLDPRAEALLYAADKAQHVRQVVEPALERGEIVVSDRYVESMLAYQGAGRVLDAEAVAAIAWWGAHDLRPDLTVLLDISVEDGLAERPQPDRLEQAGASFHARVREGFLRLAAADPARHLVLDARAPREEIAAAVRERLAGLLG